MTVGLRQETIAGYRRSNTEGGFIFFVFWNFKKKLTGNLHILKKNSVSTDSNNENFENVFLVAHLHLRLRKTQQQNFDKKTPRISLEKPSINNVETKILRVRIQSLKSAKNVPSLIPLFSIFICICARNERV